MPSRSHSGTTTIHRTSSFNERLAESGRGSVRPLLTSAGVNAGKLRTDIEQALSRLPQVEGTGGDVQPSQDLVRILNLCDKLAQKKKDNFISSELFVLAALESRGTLTDL